MGTDGGDACTGRSGRGAWLVTLDRAAALLEDVVAAPDTIARLLDAYAERGGPLDAVPTAPLTGARIVFSGLGSSRFAALDAATLLRANGLAAWVEYASTPDPSPPGEDVIFVAISASGRTPEVIDAIERHRGTSLVIGVTNDPAGRVGVDANVVLPLFAGEERSGISCRTFQATNAVLALLAGRLGGGAPRGVDLHPAIDALARIIGSRSTWVAPAADLFDGGDRIGIIAGALEQGIAEQAALMFREGPRLAAAAHDAGDWLHTAIYTALPGYRALMFGGTAYDETLVRTIRGRGGEVLAVGDALPGATRAIRAPVTNGPARRLTLSTIADLVAAELWARSGVINSGDPE